MSETEVLSSIAQAMPGAFFAAHRNEVVDAMRRVLDSGWYILGREVQSFEEEFAGHFGFGQAIGVGSGTDAIALALRALEVEAGDFVATVSHTAGATAAAIEMTGATPVFVDIDPDTYCMDPESLARTLSSFDSVKAVIAVHLYGHPADVSSIAAVARQLNANIIEDCCQAHGAKLEGRFVGGLGDVAAFSFYPTKNLGAMGDGGIVVTNAPDRAKCLRMLREYGWERRYISERAGVNSRLDELQAAILRVRLPYLDAANLRRATLASIFDEGLKDTGLILPKCASNATHVFHQYVVRHPERDEFVKRLRQRGVSTNIHYPVPIHRQPAYSGRCRIDPAGLSITEAAAAEIVSLPMYPELSDRDAAYIVDAVRKSV